MSDDGEHGLTLIAFIGSVFSPYYAWARRHAGGAGADPLNHCAVNVALYGRRGGRWCMTERGRGAVRRDANMLRIGPSALHWTGSGLQIDLDEVSVPWPGRVRGTVTLEATQCFDAPVTLAQGHRWCPIAPMARVDVQLGELRWQGPGYLDANHGDSPLEDAFIRWDWSRAHLPGGDSAVLYDLERRHEGPLSIGLRLGADGWVEPVESPPTVALPVTGWRVPRGARGDPDTPVQVVKTLTDAPFYARSLLRAQWWGQPVEAMHESLSLTRFDSRWVQAMLPFRMPRR